MTTPSPPPLAHPEIDDAHLVDRYLAGRLDDDTEARFEEHLFSCAACLEAVEAGDDLRRGLRDVATEDAARQVVAQRVAATGLLAWLGRRGLTVGALALVLLAVPLLIWQQREIDRLQSAPVPTDRVAAAEIAPGGVQVVSLGTVRSGDGLSEMAEIAEVSVEPGRAVVLLSLDPPGGSAGAEGGVRVTLEDAAGEVLWSGDDLAPSLYGTLLVAVPTTALEPGRYRVRVEDDGAETVHEIRVTNDL